MPRGDVPGLQHPATAWRILGHAHLQVVAAIQASGHAWSPAPRVLQRRTSRLLERLVGFAPAGLNRVFLCNSGAESIEGALKFARYSTGRPGVVATMRAFHGRTMGALSATHNPKYREPFEPLVPGFTHIPYNNLDAAAEALGDDVAAMIVEPVQGESGVRPATAEYLQGLRRLCDERGVLLIIDEVQTGMGRTGQLFACQHAGVTPDILCWAKASARRADGRAPLARAWRS